MIVGVRGVPERRIFSWARSEGARLRIPVSVAPRPGPARPDPARPGPTGDFDPRVSALKMADLVTPVLALKTPFGLKIMEILTTSARGIRFRHSRGLLGPPQVPFWQLKNCISTKRPPKAPFGLKILETLTISERGIRF